jgi:hypothetical protein
LTARLAPSGDAGPRIALPDVERGLGFYLRALFDLELDLRTGTASVEARTGQRASILNGALRMPPGLEDGRTLYRAMAAHAAAHLTWSAGKFSVRGLRPVQLALVGLLEDARVEHLALREMPGLRNLWVPYHAAVPGATVTAPALLARLARALIDAGYDDSHPFVVEGRRLFAARHARLGDPLLSRELGVALGERLEDMGLPFDLQVWLIEPAYRDDNLFLWDLGDAGQQSEDRETIYEAVSMSLEEAGEQTELERGGGEQAQPDAVQMDTAPMEGAATVDEVLAQPYLYDEWDYLIGAERRRWCTLLEKMPPAGDPHVIDEVLRRNDETVQRLTTLIKAVQIQRPRRLRKQLEGDRLDIDACIAATLDLRSGRAPDPRVHHRPGRNNRDLAVLLLLDLSQSTNDWVPGAGSTVLNLAREATALVAHAMHDLGDSFAIHGFDSNGRHGVEYYRFKDFDEPYGEHARARLAGMRGQLSTRMGCALRHAGHFLRGRRVAQRLVLVLTDGEPHDIDVQDKQYLVLDTKRAVEDQRRYGIATYCISLDPAADEYVARIFGARNYMVLDQLGRLPEKLPALYLRLTRN